MAIVSLDLKVSFCHFFIENFFSATNGARGDFDLDNIEKADHVIITEANLKKAAAVALAQSKNFENSAKTLEIQSSCSDDWFQFGSDCVRFFPEARYKPFAKRECFDLGGIILNVNSKEESDFFASIAAQNGAESFWLGINDGQEDGNWVQDRIGYSKGFLSLNYTQIIGCSHFLI